MLPFFEISLVVGICFLIAALISYLFPPKKINDLYGYRTAKSKKNIENRNFSQKYSTIKMLEVSIMLILLSFLGYFFKSEIIHLLLGLTLVFGAVIYIFITTEKALSKFEQTKSCQ
ncbi:SdpI family protein [Flavobacterium croceum]|uniref:SdpI family protein n=1 Tax=Flavobacterium croceum TaxID=370975 RepID=UPI0024A9FDC1|nr:SdpI family protein [Flavobacterium croceum]